MTEEFLLELKKIPDLNQPPERVVSLVPSTTESLFDLGFGQSVVGITDYCIHPKEKLIGIQQIGGPKTPDIQTIADLKPDLVFANQEENSPEAIREIVELGIRVWVSFPQNIDQSLDELRNILAIYQTDKSALQIVTLQNAVDFAKAASDSLPVVSYFCPIWMDKLRDTHWWMTFNKDTFSHDLLSLFSGVNIFTDRERRYPIEADLGLMEPEDASGKDTRYPRITSDEVVQQSPDVIFLPDDPFQFEAKHMEIIMDQLGETSAVQNKRIHFIDGSLITWSGTRMGKALQALPNFFKP